jgi:periplasmic copper chaperone A
MITMQRTTRLLAAALTVAVATGGLAACGGDDDGAGLDISGAWARTSPAMADAGAAYLTIASDEAVSIVAAEVDPAVAGVVELHEVVPVDGDMHSGDMADGEMAMTMQEVASIDIEAGDSVRLEPGGLHVMLLELPTPLETGAEFDLTLVLDDGSEIVVPVEVRDSAP